MLKSLDAFALLFRLIQKHLNDPNSWQKKIGSNVCKRLQHKSTFNNPRMGHDELDLFAIDE